MYAIISEGSLIALCDKPRYIKFKEGILVEATAEDAQGIAVGGEPYNLPGGDEIPDRPEAFIREEDAGEFVFQNRARIAENEETTGSAIVQMEDAMCEQDTANDERMTAIEDALCELDNAVHGGGEN